MFIVQDMRNLVLCSSLELARATDLLALHNFFEQSLQKESIESKTISPTQVKKKLCASHQLSSNRSPFPRTSLHFCSFLLVHFSATMASLPSSADVTSTLGARARPVLDLVDDLRALGLQRDVPIPQVAVMGDQSSGKSSVLQALSRIPFPRGRGLETRCAAKISMRPGKKWEAEIRAGSKANSVAIENKTEITAQIEKMTNELCGSDTFCADEIIEIKLLAPGLPDLTLIDLPGIVRTATTGQDEKVMRQVDSLLNQYLSQLCTVILAVIRAPSDIVTVDILERAAKVDPHGN